MAGGMASIAGAAPALARALTPIGRHRTGPVLVWLGVLVLLAVQAFWAPLTDDATVDSHSYYFGARALADGANPYDTAVLQELAPDRLGFVFPYVYPPVLALAWRPLLALTPEDAHRVAIAVGLVLTTLNASLLWSLVRPRTDAAGWLVLFLGAHTVMGPLVSSLRLGQVNVALATLVLGALHLERRDRPALAGLLLAGAILVKLTPAVFLVDLLLRGRWRTIGFTAVGGTAIVGISIMLVGTDPWAWFVERARQPLPFNPPISIRGWVDALGLAFGWDNAAKLVAFLTIFTAALVLVVRRLLAFTTAGDTAASWAVLVWFGLLAFPLTWHHHYYLAILPFALFMLRAFDAGHRWRAVAWVVLAAMALARYPGALHPLKPIASLVGLVLV